LLDFEGHQTSFLGSTEAVLNAQRLINISSRAISGTGDDQTIAGFVLSGVTGTEAMIRGVGPGLLDFGVSGALTDPGMRVFRGSIEIASNRSWGENENAQEIRDASVLVGAYPLNEGSADAALLDRYGSGSYTAIVGDVNGVETGEMLLEVYVISDYAPGQKLQNISTRSLVGQGRVTITGFVIEGEVPKRILIRGIGPSLEEYGVANFLKDPQLVLFRGPQVIATNDDWSADLISSQTMDALSGEIGAFPLEVGSKDSAILVNLMPGPYTLHIRSADDTAGVSLLEVYEAP
jgi:hypothetical protein